MTLPPLTPVDLRTEGRREPLGLDAPSPRLSWKLHGDGRGRMQTAYRILVAADADPVEVEALWDSGVVRSPTSVGVPYGGPPLRSRTRYCWRVRVGDESGSESDWSTLASWETGLTAQEDWTARWIGAGEPEATGLTLQAPRSSAPLHRIRGPLLRGRFTVPSGARPLGALVTIGGAASAWLNGEPIPPVGDVLSVVRTGENVLAIAADEPVVARLEVWLDGFPPIGLDTDGKWRAAADAPTGWERPEFDDGAWPLAESVGRHGDPPRGREPVNYRPSPYLRREFHVDRAVRRARVYATALGLYELRINGARIGDDYLAPGWTDYAIRVPYQTYDVTNALTQGENVIGAILGDGWYAGNVCWFGQFQYGRDRLLRLQLEIEYADGGTEVIGSDDTWSVGTGGLRYADLQNGTVFDARLEPAGWDRPGFPGGGLSAASVGSPAHGALLAQLAAPVRVHEELPPRTVTRREDGRILVDFGQNLVGWVRVRLRGSAGDRIVIRHAEVLQANGELYTEALRSAVNTDEYIFRGDADGEVFEPQFTVHGFRYAEIYGDHGGLDDIVARVAFSAMEPTGDFRCSNPALDRLQQNIVWGQRGNFLTVPTDCPQRDERLGWTGDAQVFAATAAFNYDVRGFFQKWLVDLTDAQRPDGAVTHVAPDVLTPAHLLRSPGGHAAAGAAGWGDAVVIVPRVIEHVYGDRAAVETTYDAVSRWMSWLERHSDGLVRPAEGFGDWLAITQTPTDLVSTAFFAYTARLSADLARTLDRKDDTDRYDDLFSRVRAAFRDRYVEGGGVVASGTQTAYVLAIHCGLLDAAEVPRAAQRLVEEIESRNWHLTTGFLGTPYLLSVLAETGHLDVAYRLLMQDTFPSWLYPVVHGDATTVWERWDSWSDSRGFQDPGMTSFNHYAYGAVGEWMYSTVGGIAPAAPGYREITVRPRPGGGLTWARTTYESVYGRISSAWRRDGAEFSLDVTVPPNTTAEIWVPAADPAAVTEGGGAPVDRLADGAAVYRVGSGSYAFRAGLSG